MSNPSRHAPFGSFSGSSGKGHRNSSTSSSGQIMPFMPTTDFGIPPYHHLLLLEEQKNARRSESIQSEEFDFASVFSRGNSPIQTPEDEDDDASISSIDSETAHLMAVRSAKFIQIRREFNPITWTKDTPTMVKYLRNDAVPGSFKHLLLLLLEPGASFMPMQVKMQRWFAERFSSRVYEPDDGHVGHSMRMLDRTQLVDELEVLRKLVRPLREGKMEPRWIDKAYDETDDILKGLQKASRIIEEFEEDIVERIQGQEGTLHSLPEAEKPSPKQNLR